jgi:uncharacterized protein with FMN-binding domain
MRKSATTATAAAALAAALPTTQAWAAARSTATKATAKKKVTIVTKSFTGTAVDAGEFGPLQVTVFVRKTTTTIGARRTVARRITAVKVPVYPDHTDRSVYISQQALPLLIEETLKAQSAKIYLISNATYTSDAFGQSLQAAILQSKAW